MMKTNFKSALLPYLHGVDDGWHAAVPKRVLVVEDDPPSQEYVETVLYNAGHSAKTVPNGFEALEVVKKQPFDVVLMDVKMRGMSGIEATKAIRNLEKSGGLAQVNGCRKLWIIAYTASAMLGDKERFLASGMDDYLAKPLRKNEILAALDRASSKTTG